jgi:hypothetical protein
MSHSTQNRLFAGFGIGSVLIELAGVGIGALGGRPFATISSTPAQIQSAFAKPVGTAAWAGAYLEMLSFGLFLAFAMWACIRLGGGLLGSIAGAAAAGYVALSMGALGVGDAIAYRAGHPIGLPLASMLITLNEALYVCSWFLAVFFLLAAAPLALAAGRRVLGWSGIGVATVILVTTAVSLDNLGQMSNLLWLIWIVAASLSLARERAEAPIGDVAIA